MGTKVFGVGFQLTGTRNLKLALQTLGYRVTGPNAVRDPDIDRMLALAETLVESFDAFLDVPWPLIYRQMDEKYPGSKFILTVRDSASWYLSARTRFHKTTTPLRTLIFGAGAPVGNRSTWISRYERHLNEVRDYFHDRPGDLLVMDLDRGDGWEALCGFLGVPIPEGPFPHSNTPAGRQVLRRDTRERRARKAAKVAERKERRRARKLQRSG